jgi:HAD superfamily phosphoserine phosphatase-like hydrolase
MQNKLIFCDFDGTITKEDTIDKLLENYANSNWIEIENLWKSRQIGSKECLKRQIDCIDYFTAEMLDKFIDSIEINEHFSDFIDHIKRIGIEF